MHAEANILNNPFRPFPEVAAIIAPNPGFTMPGFPETTVQQSPETENRQAFNVVQSITAEMLLPQEQAEIMDRAQELFTTLRPNGYYEVPFQLEQDEILGILGFPAEPGSQLDAVYQQYLDRIAEINGLGGNAQLHLMLQLQNGEFFQGALAIRVQNTYTEQRLDANGTLQNRSVSRGSYVLFSQHGEHLIQPTQPDSSVTLILENSEITSQIVLALEARGIEVAETDSAFLAVELNRNNDIVSLITNHEQIVFERQMIRRGETVANIRVLPDTNSAAITWDTAVVGLPYELSPELRNTITRLYPGAVITEENGEVRVSIGQYSWQFVRRVEEDNFQDGFIRQDVRPPSTTEATPIPTPQEGIPETAEHTQERDIIFNEALQQEVVVLDSLEHNNVNIVIESTNLTDSSQYFTLTEEYQNRIRQYMDEYFRVNSTFFEGKTIHITLLDENYVDRVQILTLWNDVPATGYRGDVSQSGTDLFILAFARTDYEDFGLELTQDTIGTIITNAITNGIVLASDRSFTDSPATSLTTQPSLTRIRFLNGNNANTQPGENPFSGILFDQ